MNDPRAQSLALIFLEKFWADQDAGEKKTLIDYLMQFPGDEAIIATEYLNALAEAHGDVISEEFDSQDSRIGPYRLIEELGRGGQGVVWLAEDTRLGRSVALKVLAGQGPGAASHLARFKREAALASKLEHPGICGVHDTGIESGVAYIAMRYVDGETLSDRNSRLSLESTMNEPSSYISFDDDEPEEKESSSLSKTSSSSSIDRPELDRIIATFEKIARALHAAHEVGIVHRDIKPGNIIVSKTGEPVLLDFGLARDNNDDSGLTLTGDLFGTPAYMSPEQLMANRVRLDRRTDIYSLGVTLFECLTLKRPFDAPTRDGLYQSIMTAPTPNARRINPKIPKDLRVVLDTTLEKNRDRRYKTALEFAEELKRVRELVPILARPVGPIGRLTRWAARNPGLATSLCGLFLTMLIGTVVSIKMAQRADRQKNVAEAETRRANRQSAQLEKGLYDYNFKMASTAIKDRRFDVARTRLQSCPQNLRGLEWRLLSSHLPEPIAPPPSKLDDIRGVTLSRDGRTMAATSASNTITVSDVNSGVVKSNFKRKRGDVNAISPDGRFLLTGRFHSRIISGKSSTTQKSVRLWNTATNKLIRKFDCPVTHSGAAFDSTGSQCVATTSTSAAAIYRTKTGQEMVELETPEDADPWTFAFKENGESVFGILRRSNDDYMEIREWDARTGKTRSVCPLDTSDLGINKSASVSGMRFQIDARHERLFVLALGNLDMFIFDLSSGQLEAHAKFPSVVAGFVLVPETNYFIPLYKKFSTEEGVVDLWDGRNGKHVKDLCSHFANVGSVAVDMVRKRIYCATALDRLRAWKLNLLDDHLILGDSPSEEALRSNQFVRFSPDGKKIVAGGSSGDIRIWNRLDGSMERTIQTDLGWVSPHFHKNQLVVLGWDTANGNVVETDNITGKRASTYRRQDKTRVPSVALSHNGKYVATAAWNSPAKLFDRNSQEELLEIETGFGNLQYEIAFSPDDRFVALGVSKANVRVCEIKTGKVSTLESNGQITSLAFSPDGELLVIGSNSEALELWDMASMTQRQRWTGGHEDTIWSVAFSPDGKRIVAGDGNGQMTIWHVDFKESLLDIQVSKRDITDLAFSPDGNAIVAIDEDGQVTLFDLHRQENVEARLMEFDARRLIRNLLAEHGDTDSTINALSAVPGLSPDLRNRAVRYAKRRGVRPLELAQLANHHLTSAAQDPDGNPGLIKKGLQLATRADNASHHRCPEVLEILARAQEMAGHKNMARQTLESLIQLRVLQAADEPFNARGGGRASRARAKISQLRKGG
ncbi:MAG: serine/threonine protein kinase [Planctomycetota bacterium]|jgi:serine/threonine protein kinase